MGQCRINGANVTSFQPWGYSNYNGLQMSFKRNFTNGLQFQAAWTWSHTFDNSTADVFSTVLTPRRPQNFACFACDYGTSALDRRHRVTLAATYDLPFFKNDNWFMKNVVGNWQFSPIYTFQSPEYATVQSDADANLNGDSAPDRAAMLQPGWRCRTPSSTVTALKNSAGATVAYVANNPTAQYIQAGSGRMATVARNTLATPRHQQLGLRAAEAGEHHRASGAGVHLPGNEHLQPCTVRAWLISDVQSYRPGQRHGAQRVLRHRSSNRSRSGTRSSPTTRAAGAGTEVQLLTQLKLAASGSLRAPRFFVCDARCTVS